MIRSLLSNELVAKLRAGREQTAILTKADKAPFGITPGNEDTALKRTRGLMRGFPRKQREKSTNRCSRHGSVNGELLSCKPHGLMRNLPDIGSICELGGADPGTHAKLRNVVAESRGVCGRRCRAPLVTF